MQENIYSGFRTVEKETGNYYYIIIDNNEKEYRFDRPRIGFKIFPVKPENLSNIDTPFLRGNSIVSFAINDHIYTLYY